MRTVLNLISMAGSFTVAFMVLYFIQYYTIGMIPKFKTMTLGRVYLKDIVFFFVSVFLIRRFLVFYMPY